jgi:hypothetical protein
VIKTLDDDRLVLREYSKKETTIITFIWWPNFPGSIDTAGIEPRESRPGFVRKNQILEHFVYYKLCRKGVSIIGFFCVKLNHTTTTPTAKRLRNGPKWLILGYLPILLAYTTRDARTKV